MFPVAGFIKTFGFFVLRMSWDKLNIIIDSRKSVSLSIIVSDRTAPHRTEQKVQIATPGFR